MHFATNQGAIRGSKRQRCTGRNIDSTQNPARVRTTTMGDFSSVTHPGVIFVFTAIIVPKYGREKHLTH